MTHVSIIGSGTMGEAIAGIATKGGNTAELLGEDRKDTPATGDIIVLAVPYPAVDDVLAERAGQFDGKIVVDITNPVDFETFDSLTVPSDSSSAAQTAGKLPNSQVLKAFNTTFAATLASGNIGPLTTTVMIAGDDGDAKKTVADVITAGGLKAVDAGSLKRARELEAFGFLQMSMAVREELPWTGGFGIVTE